LLGVALVLSLSPRNLSRRMTLQIQDGATTTPATSPAAVLVADNALAPCLPLFESLAKYRAASIDLALGDNKILSVTLDALG
jgi:hypothetical protein